MQSQDSSLTVVQTDSVALTAGLSGLRAMLFDAAEANIANALGDDVSSFTALQRRAMVATEALRMTTGLDLSTVLTRGDIIRQIETEGLAAVHPNGYANLTALAADNNVSVGELSDIRSLCDVIFPYIQNDLEMNLYEVWEQIGKSGLRELVPALHSMITGQNAAHGSVRNAVTQMLDGAAVELINDEDNPMPQEQLTTPEGRAAVRRQAVATLLHNGTTMTVREMRAAVRPTRVPQIPMATLQTGQSQWYAVLRCTSQEQHDLVIRVLNSHAGNFNLEGRNSDGEEFRRLLGTLFGVNE
jgi:hypothetical protein